MCLQAISGRSALAGTAAALLAVALTSSALANRTVIRDSRGDTKVCGERAHLPYVDIRKALAKHTKNGHLKHEIRVQNANAQTRHYAYLLIKLGKAKNPRYAVWSDSIPGEGSVVDLRREDIVGDARVVRRGNRIVYIFSAASLGDPRTYRWQATAFAGSGDCPNVDFAPNKHFRPHHL